jgi:HK97 gp10 family phage protein
MARVKIPRLKGDPHAQGRTFSSIMGLEDVKLLLKILESDVPIEYERVLRKYGERIEASAKSKITHEVTGKLKKSIRLKQVFTEKKKRVSIIAGGKAAPHAHLVEFGHRQISPSGEIGRPVPGKHFMRDAFTENLAALNIEIDEILADL